jgi:anti-sigma regulatory factor (Ser/Thr protein kinase)
MTERQRDDLAVALSEVVTNAVRHSGAEEKIELTMTPKDGYVCVQVTDAGEGLMPRPGAMETERGAGVGLFLVEQLTRRWGMTREGERTRVWFEMDFGLGPHAGSTGGPQTAANGVSAEGLASAG